MTFSKAPSTSPPWRFKEFDEAWEEKRLGRIASFTKGKGISKADLEPDGKLPCIRYGELYTEYDVVIDQVISRTNVPQSELVISEGGEVIIPASGETAVDIATASVVKPKGVALGGDLNIIKSEIEGDFLAYYLSNKKRISIARLAQGSSVIHLYSSQLSRLRLNIPSPAEQRKIAAFLGAVDEKLAALRRKRELLAEYKCGVMQQLFSQQIRFTQDDGTPFPDWETRTVGDVTENFSVRNRKLYDFAVYSVTNDRGFVLQSDQFDRQVAGQDLRGYKLISKNDFAYNPARVNVGSIAQFNDDNGIISSLYVCFRMNGQVVDQFFLHWLGLSKTVFDINRFGEGGVRVYLWYPLFSSIKIPVPSVDEQQHIVEFLDAIDRKLYVVNQQIEQINAFKKGLLQQMFV